MQPDGDMNRAGLRFEARLEAKSGAVHIPIGLHILRWWVMPLKAGETPASLVEWVEDQAQSIR